MSASGTDTPHRLLGCASLALARSHRAFWCSVVSCRWSWPSSKSLSGTGYSRLSCTRRAGAGFRNEHINSKANKLFKQQFILLISRGETKKMTGHTTRFSETKRQSLTSHVHISHAMRETSIHRYASLILRRSFFFGDVLNQSFFPASRSTKALDRG
jgi:hypothetical protein